MAIIGLEIHLLFIILINPYLLKGIYKIKVDKLLNPAKSIQGFFS